MAGSTLRNKSALGSAQLSSASSTARPVNEGRDFGEYLNIKATTRIQLPRAYFHTHYHC